MLAHGRRCGGSLVAHQTSGAVVPGSNPDISYNESNPDISYNETDPLLIGREGNL